MDQINWFANAMSFTLLPISLSIPLLLSRFGMRYTVRTLVIQFVARAQADSTDLSQCYMGVALMILGSWLRVAGTAHSLSRGSSYGLLMLGEVRRGCFCRQSTAKYLHHVTDSVGRLSESARSLSSKSSDPSILRLGLTSRRGQRLQC